MTIRQDQTTNWSEPANQQAQVRGPILRWWKEVLYTVLFYGIYTFVRNTQGSARVGSVHAFNNAKDIIRLEKVLGLYHEKTVQNWFLGARRFMQFCNVFYGTAHFLVTFGALIWCFRTYPRRYSAMRNTLACTTGLALIGFATFPLLPPRLLGPEYGFVDSLATIGGGLWSFDSGAMAKVSNQYAAMPSLHFAWSLWCVIVLWPVARSWRSKAVLVGHPLFTTFSIVVTANHFILDAAGGAVALACGAFLGYSINAVWERRRMRMLDASFDSVPSPAGSGGENDAPR